jgi:GNAT superfamily N-acetyltransferase
MIIRRFDPAHDAALLPGLARLFAATVAEGASMGPMAGFDDTDAHAFWQAQAAEVKAGKRIIVVAMAPDGGVAGILGLLLAASPNQSHRADVQKMMVAATARRHGLGAALLAAIEAEARVLGRTTLVLDTVTGSPAESFYRRCGWHEIGSIAAYARMPDGAMAATTIFARYL